MTTSSSRDRADDLVLPERYSAFRLLSHGQAVTLAVTCTVLACLVLAGVFTSVAPPPLWWAQAFVTGITIAYVLVICFRCLLVAAGPGAHVIRVRDEAITAGPGLPPYTVLVPLHREEAVLPGLVETLHRLDYPADRLQVLLLVEQDDGITRPALDRLGLPPEFEVVPVPEGGPRTKPNACNEGLARATGEFCVIYDAEDRPESDQLRKVVTAFGDQPDRVVCLQAELAYWNPWTNWLTRNFAAEYAVTFALALRGLDRCLRVAWTLADLQGTLLAFARQMFGEDTDVRLRPGYLA